MDSVNGISIEERKRKAVEFLLSKRCELKRDDQFTIHECTKLLGRKDTSSVYNYMNRLVEQGLWDKGLAIDPETGKPITVWWVKEG